MKRKYYPPIDLDSMESQSQFQQAFFVVVVEIDKLTLKCMWKCKRPGIAKQL